MEIGAGLAPAPFAALVQGHVIDILQQVFAGPHKRMGSLLWSDHLDGRNRMYLQTAKKPATRLARLPMPIYNQAAGHLDSLAIQVFV
jgi:hypothetical protein